MDTKNGFLPKILFIMFLLGILLIVISSLFHIFGYLIRELWPTTIAMYEIGIPALIGALGVIFLSIGAMFFYINIAKKKSF